MCVSVCVGLKTVSVGCMFRGREALGFGKYSSKTFHEIFIHFSCYSSSFKPNPRLSHSQQLIRRLSAASSFLSRVFLAASSLWTLFLHCFHLLLPVPEPQSPPATTVHPVMLHSSYYGGTCLSLSSDGVLIDMETKGDIWKYQTRSKHFNLFCILWYVILD